MNRSPAFRDSGLDPGPSRKKIDFTPASPSVGTPFRKDREATRARSGEAAWITPTCSRPATIALRSNNPGHISSLVMQVWVANPPSRVSTRSTIPSDSTRDMPRPTRYRRAPRSWTPVTS